MNINLLSNLFTHKTSDVDANLIHSNRTATGMQPKFTEQKSKCLAQQCTTLICFQSVQLKKKKNNEEIG